MKKSKSYYSQHSKKHPFSIFSILIISLLVNHNATAANIYLSANNNSCTSKLACTAEVTLTRASTEVLYINDDISPEKRGHYALYEVMNAGTVAIDAYVKIDNFSGDIRLGNAADDTYHIGFLAPGEKGHAYLYLVTDLSISGQNGSVSGTNTHTINVYDDAPDNGGTLIHSENFEINLVEDVIKANANKVNGISINGTPTLGSTFSITVTGVTGTIGAAKVVNFSAATNIDWPANALKLTHTIVDFSKISGNNNNDGLSFENELNFEVLDTKNTNYEITYTFLVINASSIISGYEPTAYISSGTQFKHSVLDNGTTVPDIPASGSTLSGFVWSDDDFDGIKQSGESKMNGVKVRLLDSLGNELENTTSSGTSGDFEFTGISSGNYQIKFDRNDRYVASKQNEGSDESLDSDMNRATRIVELTVTAGTDIPDITVGFTPDFDRDLIPDVVENAGSTSYDVVDPAGYFYDEATGESISGGWVEVSGPGSINIVDDGSATGYYSWLIDGTPGVYTMTVVPPGGYQLSTTRSPLSTLDPTGLTPDPYSVGSGDSDGNGFLDDYSAGSNPYYVTFELASGDPFVINNNIPLSSIFLPVELSRFEGVAKDCSVNLEWTSESEENFDLFEVERSFDGLNFNIIGSKSGSATRSNQIAHYTYTDWPPMEINYYRLKMIDLDGSFKYSKTITINRACNTDDQTFRIFPNLIEPGVNNLKISITANYSKTVSFKIINVHGIKIDERDISIVSGSNQINWDISKLPEGIYFISLIQKFEPTKSIKFIKNYN